MNTKYNKYNNKFLFIFISMQCSHIYDSYLCREYHGDISSVSSNILTVIILVYPPSNILINILMHFDALPSRNLITGENI